MSSVKKVMLVCCIVIIPLCLWFYRGHLINKGMFLQSEYRGVLNYQKEFFLTVPDNIHSPSLSYEDFIKRIQDNITIYAHTLATIIINNDMLSAKFRFFAVLLFMYGFVWCFFKKRTVIEYYCCFYLLICIIWWFNQQPQRFLAPLIPFIFYYFLIGSQKGIKQLFKIIDKSGIHTSGIRRESIIGVIVIVLILTNFSFKPSILKAERRRQFHPPALIDEFFSSIEWISENTSPESVIMSSRAPWIVMLTDRKTLTWPLFEPLPKVVDSIINNRVEYIVVSTIHGETYNLLHPFAEKYPAQFAQVFRNNKTSIYKIRREGLAALK